MLAKRNSRTLTKPEMRLLQEQVAIIDAGLHTFVEVGNALAVIREQRLYRATSTTFEAFCEEHWHMTSRHANRLMNAAEIADEVNPKIGPMVRKLEHESHARVLVAVKPEARAEVFEQASESAPEGKLTAAHIGSVAERWAGRLVQRDPEVSPAPRPVAAALPTASQPTVRVSAGDVAPPFSRVAGPLLKPSQAIAVACRHCPTCTCSAPVLDE